MIVFRLSCRYIKSGYIDQRLAGGINTHVGYLSNRPHFLWVYRRDNPLGMSTEHESRAEGDWSTSFSSVLPTSCVGYHAGKPIESVVYCFYKSFLWVYGTINHRFLTN